MEGGGLTRCRVHTVAFLREGCDVPDSYWDIRGKSFCGFGSSGSGVCMQCAVGGGDCTCTSWWCGGALDASATHRRQKPADNNVHDGDSGNGQSVQVDTNNAATTSWNYQFLRTYKTPSPPPFLRRRRWVRGPPAAAQQALRRRQATTKRKP